VEEIKPSFTIKYFTIILITIIATSLVAYAIDYYKEKQNEKVVKISSLNGMNQVSSIFDTNIIDVTYTLKKDSSAIKSFFQKTIIITNIGKKGIENIEIQIATNTPNVVLLKNPEVESIPASLSPFLNLSFSNISNNKQTIKLPLLNKDESLLLKYIAYSPDNIKFLNLTADIRKKDLKIERSESLIPNKDHNSIVVILSIFGGGIGLIILAFPLIYFKYRMRYNSSDELKKKYKDSWEYFKNN
jgi:hypothetical protein